MKNKTRNKQTKKSNNAGQRFWTTEGIRIKHSVSYFLSELSSISTASLTYNKKHRSEKVLSKGREAKKGFKLDNNGNVYLKGFFSQGSDGKIA